jgi:hypothetical protein
MRTDPGARAALAAAGHPAATVGGVIHLHRPPDRSPRSTEIVAHELVHAAHPSPRPRFFGDTRGGSEEALAEHTGGLARALVAPRLAAPPPRRAQDRLTWGTQGMAVGTMGGAIKALGKEIGAAAPPTPTPMVQRTPVPALRGSLVERTADLFRHASGAPAAVGGGQAAHVAGSADFPRPGDGAIVRRSSWGTVAREYLPSPSTTTTGNAATGGVDPALFDALVEALEQRVIDELERRGLRHHPGVF